MSELISRNNEATVIPTVLLRRFSKFIRAQPVSISAFRIKLPCMNLSSCSFVKTYLCGGSAIRIITAADPVDAIDIAIIAERLQIPALFYLALHAIYEDMVSMVRYPNRAMFVHVFTHCLSESPLKDFMLSLLYRHLFVLGRSELEWRQVNGKGVPISSKDLLPGMWLTQLRLKIGGHLKSTDIETRSPSYWCQTDCKPESMLMRKNLSHFIESIETAQDKNLIDDAPIVAFYLNAILQNQSTRCMYNCFSSLLHWDNICSLPLKRPIVVFLPAPTASAPLPTPAAPGKSLTTFAPVSLKLKRKADETASTIYVSKRIALDDAPRKKPINPRKGVTRQIKKITVVCRNSASFSVDSALVQKASKAATRQLEQCPTHDVVEFLDMDAADFNRLRQCIEKPGMLPSIDQWSLRQKLATIMSAEAAEAFGIADALQHATEPLFRNKLMCFAVAKFVYKNSKATSKLRTFVTDCLHWVLIKNGHSEKLKEECERNKSMELYPDLVAAGEMHGTVEHPCKEMRWKLHQPCVCAETITVVRVGKRTNHVYKVCDCHYGSLE